MITIDPKLKAVTRFVVTAFALYIAWFIFHDFYLLKEGSFILSLIKIQTKLSVKFITLFNFNDTFEAVDTFVFCNGKRLLRVGEECSALVLLALFSGFVICYPGNWIHKIWYIPIGVFFIFLLNILRIALLSINFKYYHSSFSFNHHVTFTYAVYLFIFFLWLIWVNKFGNVQSRIKS